MRGIVLLGAAMAWASGCAGGAPRDAGPAPTAGPASPLVSLDRAEFGEQEAGKPVWKATAKKAAFRPDSKVVDLEDVEARFYEDGKAVTRGRSPEAVWRQAEHDILLAGGATLEALDDKAGVAAREARWDPATGRLLATGGVRFWQGSNALTAAELHADRTLRRVELTGGVRGAFALGPGTPQLFDRSTGKGAAR